MKKFNLEDFLKWEKFLIKERILISEYWLSKRRSKEIITELVKKNIIVKIINWIYILKEKLNNISLEEMSLLIDKDSYVSTYTILEKKIIKQAHVNIFCITSNKKRKKEFVFWNRKIFFSFLNIPQTFWIELNSNFIKIADMERALLDLIYLHIYWKTPITSELYLKWNIDDIKIKEYLKYYPEKVKLFYYNKLKEYAK
jgi:hypothetical protein